MRFMVSAPMLQSSRAALQLLPFLEVTWPKFHGLTVRDTWASGSVVTSRRFLKLPIPQNERLLTLLPIKFVKDLGPRSFLDVAFTQPCPIPYPQVRLIALRQRASVESSRGFLAANLNVAATGSRLGGPYLGMTP